MPKLTNNFRFYSNHRKCFDTVSALFQKNKNTVKYLILKFNFYPVNLAFQKIVSRGFRHP